MPEAHHNILPYPGAAISSSSANPRVRSVTTCGSCARVDPPVRNGPIGSMLLYVHTHKDRLTDISVMVVIAGHGVVTIGSDACMCAVVNMRIGLTNRCEQR
jgi:hypothetical protein